MDGLEFGAPGTREGGQAVHLPCGHDLFLPSDASGMMFPTTVLEHLDRCGAVASDTPDPPK